MKSFFKLAFLLVVGVYVRTHFFVGREAFVHHDLLPISLPFVQGPPPQDDRPMVVEFWATSSNPCRQSVSYLNDLAAKYRPRGLGIVAISTETGSTVDTFVRGLPMDYAVALDPQKRYSKALNIDTLPHAFLLNRHGKVVWDGHPMNLMESRIESVLAEQ